MILDAPFAFGVPDITNSTADTNSVNVYDAGSAVKLFDGPAGEKLCVTGKLVVTADANPTVRVRLVGSSAAALNANVVILADTGVISLAEDGITALVTGDTVKFLLRPGMQGWAKRYYGLIFTLGGTNPDTTTASGHAHLVMNPQTWMNFPKAATP